MRRPKGCRTRKSVVKRFKITGTGKVLFHGAGRRHLLQGKSPKRRRSLRKAKILGATDLYRIKQNLPFCHLTRAAFRDQASQANNKTFVKPPTITTDAKSAGGGRKGVRIRKQVYELTPDDLGTFPVWEFKLPGRRRGSGRMHCPAIHGIHLHGERRGWERVTLMMEDAPLQ